MKTSAFAVSLALFLSIYCASSGVADVLSAFDTGADGWTLAPGGDAATTLTYSPTGGSPGGRIILHDAAQGHTDYFRAPAKFVGNESAYYNGTLQFDIVDSASISKDGLAAAVVLTDNSGNKLVHNAPKFSGATGFSYVLNENAGWTYTPSGGTAVAPTQTEFTNVLTSLASLDISGDFHDGKENTSLDNVELTIAERPLVISAVEGASVPGQSGTTTYGSFGIPETGAFAGTLVTGRTKTPAIFGSNGSVLLEVGKPMPGDAGAVIAKLGAPSGDAVLVTFKAGVGGFSSSDNVALVTGLSTNAPVVSAETGFPKAGLGQGVTIKKFLAIDGNGADVFFLASLQAKGAPTDNFVLCVLLPDSSVHFLADNQKLVVDGSGDAISTLSTLFSAKGTAADGRWRTDGTDFGIRATFTNKKQAIYIIPGNTTDLSQWVPVAKTGANQTLNGAIVTGLGLPAFGPATSAELVTLKTGAGGVTAKNDLALLMTSSNGTTSLVARKGDLVSADANGNPLMGVSISGMSDPVAGSGGNVAFMVTLAGKGAGPGIEFSAGGAAPVLIANVGAVAPGGGIWSGFSSMVLPKGPSAGPIFLGTLKGVGVSGASNTGLWDQEANGTLYLLLRTGQSVTVGMDTKIVKTIVALAPASGSAGAASGYSDSGESAVLVTFTDHTQALLTILQAPG